MTKLTEILEVAETAINQAYAHYFTNLASSEQKVNEAKFVVELIRMMQPWLLFTEESMEKIMDYIYKDQLHINLAYTLTALFRQRFALSEEDYNAYLEHLGESFMVQKCDEQGLSMMSAQYSARLSTNTGITTMLKNNRLVAMLASTMLYFNTEILAQALGRK